MGRMSKLTSLTPLMRIRHTLLEGDISMTLMLGGLGLIMWAVFGVVMFTNDLAAYAAMFPHGNAGFWVINYVLCGLAMWAIVAFNFPPLACLLTGSWVCVIWTWSAIARMTSTATYQTGNATSIVYILLGLLIIHRSARPSRQNLRTRKDD